MEGVVVPRTAVKIVVVLLVLLAAGLGWAVEARGEDPPPTIELLEPAADATVVVSPEENKWPIYRVRLTYPAGYAGSWLVSFEDALDADFTQNHSSNGASCTPNVPVCDLSFTSRTSYKPGTRVYWRVGIAGRSVASSTQSFVTVGPADRDRDGVPDFKDNCLSTPNAKQTDYERDGKGDACQPDRQVPRVKAYSGSQRRGMTANFLWRAIDNRSVTIRVTVRWHGHLMLKGSWPNMRATSWGSSPYRWWTAKPIDRRFPLGTYDYCISATDGAGNKGTSCAPYQIKA
jgi:hypothetical protein